MNRIFSLVILMWLATDCKAQAVGSLADVAIVDRESGAVLTPHYYRGAYWVAGNPGARYAIEIHNKLGGRVLAVTSVDGVNVVSGATAGWDRTGYVFGSGDRYQITGWRKSDAEIAAFTFTASPNSYAERTGRPANVGVIGVALFRERPPVPAYTTPSIDPREEDGSRSDGMLKDEAAAPAAKLGTGHGAREYSHVDHTEFERLQAQPNEVIRIRYDSLDNLLAMGIIKRARLPAPSINPFPVSPDQQYVPDPRG